MRGILPLAPLAELSSSQGKGRKAGMIPGAAAQPGRNLCACRFACGVYGEPDCSPHPFDLLAIFALYQNVPE